MSRTAVRVLIIVLASIVAVLTLLWVGLTWLLGGFRANPAQADAAPLVTAVTRVQGGIMCDAGDAGYGPDNTVPWYQAFMEVPDSPALARRLQRASHANGYDLVPNTTDKLGATTYLVGSNGDRTMEVRIYTGAKAVASCNDGETKKVSPGFDVIEVDMAYPDRVDRG